jgi:lipopolysaccharide/colanic/teichoic acid biosynthesis glycosyltransferase
MRIWPILIDSRPAYIRGHGRSGSLLLSPMGTSTVLEHLLASLGPMAGNPPVVLSHEPADVDYQHWVHAAAPTARIVDEVEEFAEAFPCAELSDAFLIVDPRCLPVGDSQISALIRAHAAEPRVAHHLVAFDAPAAGTKERLNFDATGQIRGIHRHYEEATWPFLSGIVATVLPGAAGILTAGLASRSLTGLRSALAARGVPSSDIPVEGGALNLCNEDGMLAANELLVLQTADTQAGPRSSKPIYIGSGHRVHAHARLIGPIVIHPDVEIEENATVLGPAVIGSGARIAAGAVVAHATVGPDCVVPPGQVVRDQAWFEIVNEEVSVSANRRRGLSYGERLARLSFLAAESSQLEDEAVPTLHHHLALKRAFDVAAAAIGLLVLLPLLAVIAAAVWLESRGPIFFGDQREGMGGRAFGCWKFRTMFTGAHLAQLHLNGLDQTDGPHFKVDRDPRVTKVGRILRALNVDELPQLFNVLVGQMSLVGPRPSPFRENQVCVPWREARLSVRPGITGFWQVCRHNRSAGDFHQWIEYDLLYVQHLSLWLDLKILAATLLTLGGKGGHIPDSWLIVGLADRTTAAGVDNSRETQAAA